VEQALHSWALCRSIHSAPTTGVYPLELPNKPSPPAILKSPNELGAFSSEQNAVSNPSIP